MTNRLTLQEKIAVIKCYYKVQNAEEVRRTWSQFSTEAAPSGSTIMRLVKKFESTGSVQAEKPPGRPRHARTAKLSESIMTSIKNSPLKSSKRLSNELGVSKSTIIRTLHDINYRPYRPRLIHGLLEVDPFLRIQFCENIINMVQNDDSFLDRIIWSDEAMFKLNGHVNRHNSVYWNSENPHIIIQKEVNLPGVMVWAGIWAEGIIGPFFFEGNVDGKSYHDMLKNKFWPSVKHFVHRRGLWFMQDGAPAHWSTVVRKWLDANFPNRWIGRGGSIAWPPRSPDLTPPDFFLWGYLKDKVYSRKPRTIEELKSSIECEIRGIPLNLCKKVCRSVPHRLQKCMSMEGLQTEVN